MEQNNKPANENTEITLELSNQNKELKKDDLVKKREESFKKMKDSLGEMMQIETPWLDFVELIVTLPLHILTSSLALSVAVQVFIPLLAFKEALIYASFAATSFFAGVGVDIVRKWLKDADEVDVKSKVADVFQKEGLMIRSFNKGGSIPLPLLRHLHLAEGFDGATSGDLIGLTYRGYYIVCCNIALTRTPVKGFVDSYTQDDEHARNYFTVPDGQSVVFYGSVFMFFPGPGVKGKVRLAVPSAIKYLQELQDMDPAEPMSSEQRMDSFQRNHLMEEDGSGNEPEAEKVFTQRVLDMIMQMETQMQAPVAVYADQNIACLTIQDRVYDFQCIHNRDDSVYDIAEVLYNKIALFRNILDEIIGPKGSEYTELLGCPGEQRKSDYMPFFTPINTLKDPEDDDVRTYVNDLTLWFTDIYSFVLRYSETYQKTLGNLDSVSSKFLLTFLAQMDLERAMEWYESDAGRKLNSSLEEVVVNQFRYIWNAPGKCEVRNIRRENKLDIAEVSPSKIAFDIVVNPPIRKWEYLSETNHRMVSMCDPSRFSIDQLSDETIQRELVDTFEKNLKTLNPLGYDVDHIFPAAITLGAGEKYGMKPEEISKFTKWYIELIAANMEINGMPFVLEEIEKEKKENK